ncbi:DNA helicase Pif1 like protein, partial [Pilobolus umbonatus]
NPEGRLYFVDGVGETGKSFLFNSLLFQARRQGRVAIAVASSGTASLLLYGVRTCHSMFKIPKNV